MNRFLKITMAAAFVAAMAVSSAAAKGNLTVETLTPIDEYNCVWVDDNGEIVSPSSSHSQEQSLSRDGEGEELPLPGTYDSREHGFTFNNINQGSTQACWAISTVTALGTDCKARGLYPEGIELSAAHLGWFGNNSKTTDTSDSTYGDGYIYENPYLIGGYWFTPIFTLARSSGAALEKNFPFSLDGDENKVYTAMGNYPESERYNCAVKLYEAEYLNKADRSAVKKEIIEHGAVKASYYSTSTNYNAGADGCSYYQNIKKSTNHAITVIGWNDGFASTNFKFGTRPASNGAWLCKNSWGADWGDNGYFWISYNDTSFSCVTAFTADDQKYDNIYQYDGFGFSQMLSDPIVKEAKMANVFTSKTEEFLTAVGFYTVQDNVDYTVSIYKDVNTQPENGILVDSVTAHADYIGYHTVKLEKNIKLTEAADFSVVVKLLPSDGTSHAKVAMEGKNNTFSSYSSKEGQSWVYFQHWDDMSLPYDDSDASTTDVVYNNVCVKALTNNECTHCYNSNVILPTCTEQGYTHFTCSVCGDEYDGEYVDALGHSYTVDVTEPTCTEQGYTHFTCSVCGDEYDGEYVNALGHSFIDKTVAADCTNDGYTVHTCEACGYEYNDCTVPALKHTDVNEDGFCDRCGFMVIDSSKCSCICHSNSSVSKFFYSIIKIFWKLFNINQKCDCGIRHY